MSIPARDFTALRSFAWTFKASTLLVAVGALFAISSGELVAFFGLLVLIVVLLGLAQLAECVLETYETTRRLLERETLDRPA
jgi:hypothetical protein